MSLIRANAREKARTLIIFADLASPKFGAKISALSRACPPPSLAPPHAIAWPCGRNPCALERRLRGPWTSAVPNTNFRRIHTFRNAKEAPTGAKPIFHGEPLPAPHPAPSARIHAEAGLPAGGYFDNGARAALWRLPVGWEGRRRESPADRAGKPPETPERACCPHNPEEIALAARSSPLHSNPYGRIGIMFEITLQPISEPKERHCPECRRAVLRLHPESAECLGQRHWLFDGDTIPGLLERLRTGGKSPDAVGHDYALLVGRCPYCGEHYFVVEVAMIDAQVDDDFEHVYFRLNGDRGVEREQWITCRGDDPTVPGEWTVTAIETPRGPMLHHCFGPFALGDPSTAIGPYGVAACQASAPWPWQFASDLVFRVWDDLVALARGQRRSLTGTRSAP
jgi:hypothetical protein